MAANSNATSILGVKITGVTGDPSSNLVYASSPTLSTPILGVATATTINKLTITTPASSATLTIANLKTLTVSNTLTLTGTDGSSVNFGAGGTVIYDTITTLASLVSVGTITTGVWNATAIATNKGGTPTGGTAGQALVKNTNANYDYSWATISGGGGVSAVTGTANRITSSGGTTPIIDISAAYVGQATITILGTIATGVWNATPLGTTKAGTPTGGTTGQVLTKNSSTNYDYSWTTVSAGGAVSSVSGTTNRVTVTPTTGATVVDISSAYVGQATITTVGTIATGTWNATAISAVKGGTGLTTFVQGALLRATALNTWAALTPGTTNQVLQMVGGLPTWASLPPSGAGGTVTSVQVSGGTTGLTFTGGPITSTGTITMSGLLGPTFGGTGLAAYVQGDILYASATNVLSKLPKSVTTGHVLTNGGAGNNPSWGLVNIATVTGVLPLANLAQGSAKSVLGVAGNVTATNASIASTVANQVFRSDTAGTGIGWGSINLASATTVGTSVLAVVNGGTGISVLTSARILVTTSAGAYAQVLPTGTNGITIGMASGAMAVNYAFNSTRQALTDTPPITWNVSLGEAAFITITNTARTLVITNPVAGRTYSIEIIQGAGGLKTVTTWPTGTLWEGGSTPTLSTAAGKIDLFTFYYTGANYLAKLVGRFN